MRLRAKCTPLPAHFALSTSSALSFFLTATPQSSFGCLKFSASHSGGEVLTSSVLLPLAVCLLRYRTERSSPSHQEKNKEKWILKKMEMLFSCWLLSNYTILLFFTSATCFVDGFSVSFLFSNSLSICFIKIPHNYNFQTKPG